MNEWKERCDIQAARLRQFLELKEVACDPARAGSGGHESEKARLESLLRPQARAAEQDQVKPGQKRLEPAAAEDGLSESIFRWRGTEGYAQAEPGRSRRAFTQTRNTQGQNANV